MFKDLIRQKEHMVLPDLAQDLAQVLPGHLPDYAAHALPSHLLSPCLDMTHA